MSEKAILVVDLGNSSTKCKVLYKKEGDKEYSERHFELSNCFGIVIDDDYTPSTDYTPENSTIVKVDYMLGNSLVKGNYANGKLQENEFSINKISPSAKLKKYEIDNTPISYRLAFLSAFRAVADMKGVSDFVNLDIEWKVVTLLPPGDYETGIDKMKKIIKDIDRVEFMFPKLTLNVKVEDVVVFPEGYCAYASVVYNRGMRHRPTHKYLLDETVLVLDIGAGTTDCLIVRKNTLIQNSKFTVPLGGNNIDSKVKIDLLKDGVVLDTRDIKEGVRNGFVKDGAKKLNIIDKINAAKEETAGGIVQRIIEYLEAKDIQPRSIGYLLICGGGSIDNTNDDKEHPLSDLILQKFKNYVPTTAVITLPYDRVQVEENGKIKEVIETLNPRDLNLIGASILAEAL